MRFLVFLLITIGFAGVLLGQQAPPASGTPQQSTRSQEVETEQIQSPTVAQTPPQATARQLSQTDAAEVKALLRKIWLAEYRINDLLTEVHPERWKLTDAARGSFLQLLEALRTQLRALEDWRTQFEQRPDSMYLGFETYVAIGAVLPRLEGVTGSISRHENPSLGAQFNQSLNQLFDLQQALRPYLGYLLRIQDQLLLAAQTNLAACQNELGYAMRGKTEPAKPMKTILPEFKGRRARRAKEPAGKTAPGEGRDMVSGKNPQQKP